jgi:hypothetical protein
MSGFRGLRHYNADKTWSGVAADFAVAAVSKATSVTCYALKVNFHISSTTRNSKLETRGLDSWSFVFIRG